MFVCAWALFHSYPLVVCQSLSAMQNRACAFRAVVRSHCATFAQRTHTHTQQSIQSPSLWLAPVTLLVVRYIARKWREKKTHHRKRPTFVVSVITKAYVREWAAAAVAATWCKRISKMRTNVAHTHDAINIPKNRRSPVDGMRRRCLVWPAFTRARARDFVVPKRTATPCVFCVRAFVRVYSREQPRRARQTGASGAPHTHTHIVPPTAIPTGNLLVGNKPVFCICSNGADVFHSPVSLWFFGAAREPMCATLGRKRSAELSGVGRKWECTATMQQPPTNRRFVWPTLFVRKMFTFCTQYVHTHTHSHFRRIGLLNNTKQARVWKCKCGLVLNLFSHHGRHGHGQSNSVLKFRSNQLAGAAADGDALSSDLRRFLRQFRMKSCWCQPIASTMTASVAESTSIASNIMGKYVCTDFGSLGIFYSCDICVCNVCACSDDDQQNTIWIGKLFDFVLRMTEENEYS